MANLIDNAIGNVEKIIGGGIKKVGKFAYNGLRSVAHGAADFLNQSGSLGDNTYKGTQKQRDLAPKSTRIIKTK